MSFEIIVLPVKHLISSSTGGARRALVTILKLLVIFERVPVHNALKWSKMG